MRGGKLSYIEKLMKRLEGTKSYKVLDYLKNISLEILSKSPIHYYCFWLNMYNFLTVFSIIFKCEGFSNFYEFVDFQYY